MSDSGAGAATAFGAFVTFARAGALRLGAGRLLLRTTRLRGFLPFAAREAVAFLPLFAGAYFFALLFFATTFFFGAVFFFDTLCFFAAMGLQ